MKSAIQHVLILTLTISSISCSDRLTQFDGMIPSDAKNVSYLRQSDKSMGVTFQVRSQRDSYQDIDAVRTKLRTSGYRLCSKSAISKWEPFPQNAQPPVPSVYWIDELYTMEDFGRFFLIRTTESPTKDGSTWIQNFSLALQIVPKGRQNMASIKEFCNPVAPDPVSFLSNNTDQAWRKQI
ncbi:hypothetical protein [Luteibacter yeojuensis]